MTPLELRPLAIGELLDRAFTLYRRHVPMFVGIMALPSIFSLVFALLAQGMARWPALAARMDRPGPLGDPKQILSIAIAVVIVYSLLLIAYWVVYMLALGATTIAVSELYVGRVTGIRSAYARVRGQLGRLLLLALFWSVRIGGPVLGVIAVAGAATFPVRQSPILVGLIIVVAMLGAFVLGSFLALRYALSVPILVLEQVTAGAALRRSVFLTRGYLVRVFLLVFCAVVLAYTSLMIFQMPFAVAAAVAGPRSMTAFWLEMAGAVSGTFGAALTAPIMVIGVSVLYYDLRVRKEALDLQVMMSALDVEDGQMRWTAPPAPPSPALPD